MRNFKTHSPNGVTNHSSANYEMIYYNILVTQSYLFNICAIGKYGLSHEEATVYTFDVVPTLHKFHTNILCLLGKPRVVI